MVLKKGTGLEACFTAEQLWEAWERVRENEGCAGADGVTIPQFAKNVDRRLEHVRERVAGGGYRAFPLLKIVVEKKPGSAATRTLLVPTVGDRVLQTAVARHLSRSFEEEFLECSYGYRPGRSVDRAIARIRKCHELGYRYVVDGDIERFFDRVDQSLLLKRLEERESTREVMDLLRQWVFPSAWDGTHVRRVRRGVPQGSPISPLLANLFLEDFDVELEKSGCKLIRYGDDFLILTKSAPEAQQTLLKSGQALAAAHLELNAEKTRIVDFDHGFKFLGALFEGEGIWVPWKNDRKKGRILYMARPMPLAMRGRYESTAAPRGTMEVAMGRAGVTAPSRSRLGGGSTRLGSGGGMGRGEDVAYLYVTEQGAVLRKAGDRFLVEKEDEVLLDIPYHKLETVLLFGNVQVTTQAMAELLEKGVNLSLFSRQGMYRGMLSPAHGKNVELRIAQFERYRDGAAALRAARAIVKNKLANGLEVLARYREKHTGQETCATTEYDTRRAEMEGASKSAEVAADIAAVDGCEGAGARAYFSALMEFNRSGLEWPGRRKHPATDPLNALLSLAYTLLTNELTGLLEGAGLDPYLGFLHQADYGRPSLALDLVEAFRHPVADRLVLTLVNRDMIGADDFNRAGEAGGLFLKPAAMKRFFGEYERWMLERPSGAGGGASPGFRDHLKADVEALAGALRAGKEFEPFRWGERHAAEAAGGT